MTIIDYLLLGAFAAAALYIGYRPLLGWLRMPPHEIESETSNIPDSSTAETSARERELALEAASCAVELTIASHQKHDF